MSGKDESDAHKSQAPEEGVAGAFAGLGRSTAIVLTRVLTSFGRAGIAGSISGMAEETAGFPLDLVKTRMQVQSGNVSAFGIIRETIRQDGFAGLFRGLGPPFVASAVITSVVFGAYGRVGEILISRQKPSGSVHDYDVVTTPDGAVRE
eukprot:Colp12_sorted_trinity150504_noHs@32407